MNFKVTVPSWVSWTLFASMILVAILGVSVFFWSRWKVNQLKSKYKTEQEKLNQQRLIEIRGENWNKVPEELKLAFNSEVDQNDIENIVNTVILNNYSTILIASTNHEYEASSLLYLTDANVYIPNSNLNVSLWNIVITMQPQYFKRSLNIIDLASTQSTYDLILATNKNKQNIDIFESFFNKLNQNGMLMIRQDITDKSELNSTLKTLKMAQVPHEVMKIKAKYLLIVKK
ncbi:BC85_0335 family putative methyltransferase [Mycoplasma simbae]|uniref:BC85_0335 family putative methyltransferase n=1 Tax=Mycoplasma simbae TaxID=36744 RepID=UPI000495E981|nr:hypothetical protein [Mycoplasma simbae]